jgi:Taurine catabolism dioxygenase TauD, TfdA family
MEIKNHTQTDFNQLSISTPSITGIHWRKDSPIEIAKSLQQKSLIFFNMGNSEFKDNLKDLEKALGNIVPSTSSVNGMFNIYYSDNRLNKPNKSNQTQSPHIDRAYSLIPPRIVILYCESQAKSGGESTFVYLQDLFDGLLDNFTSEEIADLFSPDAYTIEGTGRVMTRSIFKLYVSEFECRIESFYGANEFNPAKSSNQLTKDTFDFIKSYVQDTKNQLIIPLGRKEGVVFMNTEILHGRKEWQDGESDYEKRQVIRVWFDGNSSNWSNYTPGFSAKREYADIISIVKKKYPSSIEYL